MQEQEENTIDKRIITATLKDVKGLYSSGPDPIENIVDYPLCSLGKVVIKSGKFGTGCLIGPNIVLTCAHVCFNFSKKAEHQEISFIPAVIQDRLPSFKGFKAKQVYIP